MLSVVGKHKIGWLVVGTAMVLVVLASEYSSVFAARPTDQETQSKAAGGSIGAMTEPYLPFEHGLLAPSDLSRRGSRTGAPATVFDSYIELRDPTGIYCNGCTVNASV